MTSAPAGPGVERRHLRWARLAWGLLFLSTLAWSIDQAGHVVVLPGRVEQIGTMVAAVVALWLALASNPRLTVGRTWFLVLVATLPAVALVGPLGGTAGLGAVARSFRFLLALATLALLSHMWRTDAFEPLRAHTRVLRAMIVAALLSLAVGLGLNDQGRLIAQVPALVPPQVAQFAAVATGLIVIMWLGRVPGLRLPGVWVAAGATALLLSQTRTAMVALLVGLGVAGLGLLAASGRARLTLLGIALVGAPLALLGSGAIAAWFRREQSDDSLETLTGRTVAWSAVFEQPRSPYERAFGMGYGDKSIQGLPIDSGYISAFHETGTVGVVLVVVILAVLAIRSVLEPRPVHRAVGLFVATYVAIASYTETSIGDMSPYVLHVVAAFAVLTGATSATREPPSPDVPAGTAAGAVGAVT